MRKLVFARPSVPLLVLAACSASFAGCGDDSSSPSGGGDPVEIEFKGKADIFPGLAFSTGLLPEGSPVQASFSISARGTSEVDAIAAASGSKSAPVLTGLPGRGELTLEGGFAMVGRLKAEVTGFPPYDGPIPGIENVEIPIAGTESFDPFVIDGKATVRAEIPEGDLPGIPLPGGIPGQLVLSIAAGSFVEQDFVGVCAGADGTEATYDGHFDRRGSLVITPRIEIDVPLVDPVELPELTVDLALPSSNIAMTAKIEEFGGKPADGDTVDGSCRDAGQGGGSGDGGKGQGPASTAGSNTGSSADGSGGAGSATTTTTTTTSVTSSSSTGGLDCPGNTGEPNGSLVTATVNDDPVSCEGPTASESDVLAGYDDIDIFAFTTTSDICAGSCGDADACPTGPGLVGLSPQGADVLFCMFVECAIGGAPDVFFCEDGAAEQQPIDGIPGCCSTFDFHINVECSDGGSTSTTQYVITELGSTDVCTDYAFTVVNEELF